MSEITKFITARYGKLEDAEHRQRVIGYLEGLWCKYVDLADPNFISEFTSGNEDRFLERFWEMYLANRLLQSGLEIESAPAGPDFKITSSSGVTWVEAVAVGKGTEKNQLPSEYMEPDRNEDGVASFTVPHEEILLRWTTAIDAKAKKFICYRKAGIIGDEDKCVIAVNSCKLGHSGLYGVSQFPAALEAVYSFGSLQLVIDKDTMEITETTLAFRDFVVNPNDSHVPTDLFLQKDNSEISGILAASINVDQAFSGSGWGLIYVHNINAKNSVPFGFFDETQEFWLEESEDGFLKVKTGS